MKPAVYDSADGEGIELELDLENGMAIRLYMLDETAEQMISLIRNKIDGHFKDGK